MDIKIFDIFGKAAGIGGLSLAVFYFLFRDVIKKNIYTRLNQNQSFILMVLIISLISAITLSGIGSWIYYKLNEPPPIVNTVISGTVKTVTGEPTGSAKIIFDPLGGETSTIENGTYSQSFAIPSLGFPITVSVYHDNYLSTRRKIPLSANNTVNIELKKK